MPMLYQGERTAFVSSPHLWQARSYQNHTAGFPAVEAAIAMSPKSVRYYVQVARLRLDTAIVEVDASDDGDAEQKAIEWVRLLPDAEWELQPFDQAAYQPHAESMIAQDELTESEVAEDVPRRNETRYLLLKGDCETGEGDVILQPWLKTQEADLLASDLCAE